MDRSSDGKREYRDYKLELDIFAATATGDSLVRLQGTIVESSPDEETIFRGNNQASQYILWVVNVDDFVYESRALFGINVSYGVDADPGTDTFTVKVTNPARTLLQDWQEQSVNQYQLRFKVTPSQGLRYTASPSTGTSFSTATGIWNIGTLVAGSSPDGNKQLDIRVTGRASLDVPAQEQCLTVEIEHVIPEPEEAWLPVTACMEHRALITDGHFGIFAWHDCTAGSGDYPCGSQPSLELGAVKPAQRFLTGAYAVADVHRERFRSDDFRFYLDDDLLAYVLTNNMVLQPEEVVLHVPDDSSTRRETLTGDHSWTTSNRFPILFDDYRGGIDSSWSGLKESVTVSGVDGAASPGRWRTWNFDTDLNTGIPFEDNALDATGSAKVEGTPYDPAVIPASGVTLFNLDFEALGTYEVLYEIEGTKSGTKYTDSGTYTFHVGPVAELAVRDDPAHSLAEPGRRAYTIVARNHGPNAAPAVRVSLTGVPEDSETIASRGEYVQGACGENGLCEGIWSLGEMVDTASAANAGRTDGEVLTIIPSGGGSAPITATIQNTRDYSVVIDGTTYTTNYYDYLNHNNEAEIALRPTPSNAVPGRSGAPTLLRARKYATAVLLDWRPVDRLNGYPVTHYEVIRQRGTFWEPLSSGVRGTLYADLNPGQQLRAYRVRAVNRFGVAGPWSWPSDHGQPQFYSGDDARTAPREFTATVSQDGRMVDLAWLPAATGGYTVDRHELEWRQRASDSWDCLRAYPAAPCDAPLAADATSARLDLPQDAEGVGRHYRIRVVFDDGVAGPWATTRAVPAAPGSFTAVLSDSGNTAVLTWTAPSSSSAITGYIIDISESADGDSRTNDRTVGAGVTTWTHTGLGAGDVKYYRVRARSSAGDGAWTAWERVGTGAGAPGSLRARANGPNEIVLTWSQPSSRDVEISHYDLEYSDSSASEGYEWRGLDTVYSWEDLRYVDIGLAPDTTRYYRVQAWTVDAELPAGAWSNVASATTAESGPEPPVGLSAEADGENRIRLSWAAPASGNAARYNIEHSADGGDVWRSERIGHTSTCTINGQTLFCYTDGSLHSGTTHWYRVAGVTRSGVVGEWSAPVSATTAGEATEPPGEPQNLRATGVSGRRVSLAWDPPLDNGGSRVTGYEYRAHGPCAYDRNESCEAVGPTRTSGTTATVTVPNVRGYYGFDVRALNVAGAGYWAHLGSQYVDPQRTWRVTLSPSRLTVDEGGEATYRVRLSSDPGRPVMVVLWWDGDPDVGNTLAGQQFKWLIPSNYQDPGGYVDSEWSAAWNVGVPITVTADEDDDSENGTMQIYVDVYYVLCGDLGNPDGCEDDPDDGGTTAILTVTERDND